MDYNINLLLYYSSTCWSMMCIQAFLIAQNTRCLNGLTQRTSGWVAVKAVSLKIILRRVNNYSACFHIRPDPQKREKADSNFQVDL